MAEKSFYNGNVRVSAEVLGKGPGLVCLHGGFGLDHSYFRPFLEPLAASHQLILLDARGHGRSDPNPAGGFDLDAAVADLECVRKALGHDEWSVLGHSGGGLLGAKYASLHPDVTSHLILVGSFPKFPFHAPEWIRKAHALNDDDILQGLEMFIDGLTTDAEYREACLRIAPLFMADLKDADISAFAKVTYRVAAFNEANRRYAGFAMGPAMQDFTKPTLVIHGDKDYRVPLLEGKKWQGYIPHARFELMKNAGHFPFMERPEAFCELVRQFASVA